MNPAKNKTDNQSNQKIVVQSRNMLPDTNKPLSSHEPEVISPDLDSNEDKKLAGHKIRLEPSEVGSINTSDAAKTSEPKPTTEQEAAKDQPQEATKTDTVAPSTNKLPPKQSPSQFTAQQQAQEEKIKELISEKKYFVPITHNKKTRFRKQFAVTFLLVLFIGIALIYFFVDRS